MQETKIQPEAGSETEPRVIFEYTIDETEWRRRPGNPSMATPPHRIGDREELFQSAALRKQAQGLGKICGTVVPATSAPRAHKAA